ncbi:hypothetical protein H6F43_18400 [Leptolyngbya sp. FACHB-36]|nr:hypothetical protein [Leptolyngbya sp. FACHB-36]MBD2022154.1 hypothetical protein [Leptolyngbya sp. FACHB-36]
MKQFLTSDSDVFDVVQATIDCALQVRSEHDRAINSFLEIAFLEIA